ncbi:Serine/threonine-protein kinase sepA [Leucoagaricus sp. SymC.cos]|nr:Serine/threonine-protein kinase sepA [Leucoagaricus sp. SymC.cos]
MLTDFGSFVDAVAGWRTKSSERWTAPEVLYNGKRTKGSDIWSFGCLIYYIISGRFPYWNCLDPQVRAAILAKELPYGPGYRRDGTLTPVMEACWNTNPEKRPKSWSDMNDQVTRSVEREKDSKEMVNGSAKQMKEFWNEARSNVRVSFDFERVHKNLATLLGPSHENECLSLIWAFVGRRELREYYKNLRKEDAQVIVDYLEEVLRKRQDAKKNWKLVMLLSRLIAETGRFPQAYQLADVVYDKAPVDKGGFATVYKGQWTHGPVCLKVSHHAVPGEGLPPHLDKFRKIYIKELVTWAHLSHSNVLPFYGVFSVNDTPSPVLPWMENGNLSNYLTKNPKSPRLYLIMDIVSGLAYLHRVNVIHGDLKTQNVLVSNEGRAVLADFGLVNTTTATAAGFTNPGDAFSNRWTAPEMLVGLEHSGPLPKPSTSGDIWSLACLMYEILSGRPPYFQYLQISQVVAALQNRIIPKRPDGKEAEPIRDEIWELMAECWNFNSDKRPTCQQILRQFSNLCPDYQPIKEKIPEIRVAEETRTNSSPVIDFYQTRNTLRRLATWVPNVP